MWIGRFRKTEELFFVCTILILAVALQARAAETQVIQIHHQEPALVEGAESLELTFSTPGINAGDVEDAFLFYRYDNEVSYRQEHASLISSEFKAEIEVESAENAGVLEYYFEIQLNNGDKISYPSDRETEEPVRVQIVENRNPDGVQTLPVDFTILSPEEGSMVTVNDVVVAITLFYDEEEIDMGNSRFHLLMDGEDITEKSEANNYFFSYVPGEVEPGPHKVSLLFQTPDTTHQVTSWEFSVADAEEFTSGRVDTESRNYLPQGQVELSARNQQVGGLTNDALSGNVRLSGQSGNISYAAHGLITSQEDHRLQPQNRFGAELYIGNWLDLQAGHIYPTLNSLTISGQRMQGINAGVHAFDEAINLRVLYGKMRRGVSNLYDTVSPVYQESGGTVIDTSYTLNFRENGVGTFERDLVGGRLDFGHGNNFNFGLNFLKVEDDTSSISVVKNYNDALDVNPQLIQNLSPEEQQNLAVQPEMLNVNGNPRPKGNFTAATDLMFTMDNNRVRFKADGGIGVLNQDISYGPLTYERAEEIGLYMDHESQKMLDRLSWLIIINENMSTIPFRFKEAETVAEIDASFFFPTSIVATQSELGLNYFNNNLRIRYRWIGPDFNSLANTTTRKDIAGFTITDRIRLARDRIYLTFGYESLDDNLLNYKDATTNTATYRGNVSWFPIKEILPQVSTGFMFRTRNNGMGFYNPFIADPLKDVAVYNFMQQDGQPMIGPNPRSSETYQLTTSVNQSFNLFGINHDLNMNVSYLNTSDFAFRYGDINSSNYSFMLVSNFENNILRTSLGFNINNTETLGGFNEIFIYGVNLGGSVFLLDEKLNVDASIAFTKNSTESVPLEPNINGTADPYDDFHEPNENKRSVSDNNSYMLSAGARYDITQNHSLLIDFRYNNVMSNIHQGSIPNDQLLRARYIFNF